MPGSKLVENIGTEITFQLPEEGARSGAFEQLFNDLDRNLQRLGISSYGISDTTLEEVCIKSFKYRWNIIAKFRSKLCAKSSLNFAQN